MIVTDENYIDLLKQKDQRALEYFIDKDGWIVKSILFRSALPRQERMECMNDTFFAIWQNDTGATVSKAEISPVSLYVEMNFPRQVEMTEYLDDGSGQTEVYTQWQDAPALTGVRLKDGTLIPYIVDGGGAGYMEETGDTYIQRRGLNRVIDVQQVDALLFYKTPVEDGKQPTEDNFYVVPIQ